MQLVKLNNHNSNDFEYGERISDIPLLSTKVLKNFFSDISPHLSDYGKKLPQLIGGESGLYPSLSAIHEVLNPEYAFLPFSPHATVTGPLCLMTLFYRTNGQKKKISLILPDFSKTSEKLAQKNEEINSESIYPMNRNQRSHSNVYRLAKRIVALICTFYSHLFTFLKKPLTNARQKKEAVLDCILANFHHFELFSDKQEHDKKCYVDLSHELEKTFHMRERNHLKFWRYFDCNHTKKNLRDFCKGSLVNTPTIVAKYFLARYLTGNREDFRKNIQHVLELPLPEDLRFYIHSIQYFDAEFSFQCLPLTRHKEDKKSAAKEIEALQHCPAAKAIRAKLNERVFSQLEGLLEKHMQILSRVNLAQAIRLKESAALEKSELDPEVICLQKHVEEITQKLSFFFRYQEGHRAIEPLYQPSLELFFPETLIKVNNFISYFFRLLPRITIFDSQTMYNAAASEMKELVERLKNTPDRFDDYEGLLGVLEHNALDLDELKNFFVETRIKVPNSTIEISEES
jgi:hypothetical protein